MSSSEEQGLSASLLARANEATKDPHLLWLGQKAPSPRQAAIICQILGLTNEEEKNVKAVAVLKRTWPFALQDLLQGKFFKASEAENKKPEEKKMEVAWGSSHYEKEVAKRRGKIAEWLENRFRKEIAKRNLKLQTQVVHDYYKFVYVFSGEKSDESSGLIRAPEGSVIMTDLIFNFAESPNMVFEQLKSGKGWAPLRIEVFNKAYLNLARSVGRAYEKRAKTRAVVTKEY